MYKFAIFSLLIILFVGSSEVRAEHTFYLDSTESYLLWQKDFSNKEYYGKANVKTGELIFKEGKISAGYLDFDMTSITLNNIADGFLKNEILRLVKGEMCLNTEFYPVSRFTMTKVFHNSFADEGDPNYTIMGDMDILGTVRKVTIPAIVDVKGKTIFVTAAFTLDIFKYGINPFEILLENDTVDEEASPKKMDTTGDIHFTVFAKATSPSKRSAEQAHE